MYIRKGNFVFVYDKIRTRRLIGLGWNHKEHLLRRPLKEGEFQWADWFEISWEYPGFNGFKVWSYHATWKDFI